MSGLASLRREGTGVFRARGCPLINSGSGIPSAPDTPVVAGRDGRRGVVFQILLLFASAAAAFLLAVEVGQFLPVRPSAVVAAAPGAPAAAEAEAGLPRRHDFSRDELPYPRIFPELPRRRGRCSPPTAEQRRSKEEAAVAPKEGREAAPTAESVEKRSDRGSGGAEVVASSSSSSSSESDVDKARTTLADTPSSREESRHEGSGGKGGKWAFDWDAFLAKETVYQQAANRCRAPAGNDSIPALARVEAWGPPRAVPTQGITLVTQLSLDRLPMLEHQCKFWPGAVVAAVYAPLVEGAIYSHDSPEWNGSSVEAATARLQAAHSAMRQDGVCNLGLVLYSEECGDMYSAGVYPFNAMRNRALKMATTEAVLLLDVDFVVSQDFGEEVASSQGWAAVSAQLDAAPALVLPAFEPNEERFPDPAAGTDFAVQAIKAGKAWVADAYLNRSLSQFAYVKYRDGHICTKYRTWAAATKPYPIKYKQGYEPYVVMRRGEVPWFDERFRGYGYGKVMEYYVMWRWGVGFAVHPSGYVVHAPRPLARTARVTQHLGLREKLHELFWSVRGELLALNYFPVTAFSEGCALRPDTTTPRAHPLEGHQAEGGKGGPGGRRRLRQ